MYYTYVMQSQKTGHYYIGQTSDLSSRMKRHNAGYEKSTRGRIPWRLRWYKESGSRVEAIREERRLKKLKSRKMLECHVAVNGFTAHID